MAKSIEIAYVHSDGSTEIVMGSPGASIMTTATSAGVLGIVGECGGAAMCATCHVYVERSDIDRFDPMDEDEDEMLDETVSERRSNSRLSCQLLLVDGMDRITVAVPEEQRA